MKAMDIFNKEGNIEIGTEIKLADRLKIQQKKDDVKKKELPMYLAKKISKNAGKGEFTLTEYETNDKDLELLVGEGFNIEMKRERLSFRPGENETTKVYHVTW